MDVSMAPEPQRTESQKLAEELNTPAPQLPRWRRSLLYLGRIATWSVMTPPRASLHAWSRLRPAQQVVVGFALYALIGTILLCLPFSQSQPAKILDNAFTAVSAISTTGLATVSIADTYSSFGEFVVLALFQIGGVGFMTLSSIIVLARGKPLPDSHLGVLKAGFSVPHYFVMQHFLVHVVVFTAICQTIGALILWWRFSALDVAQPLWSAIFHSVSAFATAGFSLNNNSLEPFAGDWIVNLTMGALCYLGGIGFIVAQDVWYTIKLRERMLTFTSKVILSMTAAIFLVGTALLFFVEPSIRSLPFDDRILASAFQIMTASSTAGFNTIPIGSMSDVGLVIIMIAMLIGASPSGTGGGIKTTSVSAILANLFSVLRGRASVIWLRHEIPLVRVLYAFAATSFYLIGLSLGVLLLCLAESKAFLPLVFEAASAIGTVGLSMGITADLSTAGTLIIIALMFVGRCGPLTIGLALLSPESPAPQPPRDDLAI
jgi:trk system potassium uptake protein